MQLKATHSHFQVQKTRKTPGTVAECDTCARRRAMPARMRALVSAAAAVFAFEVGGGTACAALPFPSHATMMPPANCGRLIPDGDTINVMVREMSLSCQGMPVFRKAPINEPQLPGYARVSGSARYADCWACTFHRQVCRHRHHVEVHAVHAGYAQRHSLVRDVGC